MTVVAATDQLAVLAHLLSPHWLDLLDFLAMAQLAQAAALGVAVALVDAVAFVPFTAAVLVFSL